MICLGILEPLEKKSAVCNTASRPATARPRLRTKKIYPHNSLIHPRAWGATCGGQMFHHFHTGNIECTVAAKKIMTNSQTFYQQTISHLEPKKQKPAINVDNYDWWPYMPWWSTANDSAYVSWPRRIYWGTLPWSLTASYSQGIVVCVWDRVQAVFCAATMPFWEILFWSWAKWGTKAPLVCRKSVDEKPTKIQK